MNEQYIGWALTAVMAIAVSYTVQWAGATRAFGMELADTDSGTGFQDAITPPWQTKFAMFAYGGSLLVIVATWVDHGWLSGLGSLAVIVLGMYPARLILPKLNGEHYRQQLGEPAESLYRR